MAEQMKEEQLIAAVEEGNTESVKTLKEQLIAAVEVRNTESVKTLLDAKIDANTVFRHDDTTLLARAVEHGDIDTVRTLLAAKADVDKYTSDADSDYTPLQTAALYGLIDIAGVLLDAKANVNTDRSIGLTPLHRAIIRDHADVINMLLARKADVNAVDFRGLTPLSFVSYIDQNTVRIEIVKTLLAAKARPPAKDTSEYHKLSQYPGIAAMMGRAENQPRVNALLGSFHHRTGAKSVMKKIAQSPIFDRHIVGMLAESICPLAPGKSSFFTTPTKQTQTETETEATPSSTAATPQKSS